MNWKQLKAYVNEPARTRTQLQRVAAAIGVKSDVKGDSLLGNINRRIESRIKSEEPDAMSGFTLPKARSTNNGSGNRQGERQRQGNQPPPRRPADQSGDKESTMLNSEVWVELECFDASGDLETLRKIAPHYGVRPNGKTFDTLIRDVRFALSKIMSNPAPADVDKILKEWENTPPAQMPPQPPIRREPTPSAPSNNGLGGNFLTNGGIWQLLLALAALAVIVVVALVALDKFTGDDDDDTPATTTGSVASDMFGGNAAYWSPISGSDGSGWKYTGPATEITIPANYRVDYPSASCAEAGSRGVYGPVTIERSGPLSVWNVPGETSCPASASTQPEGSSTSTAQNPATGQNAPATSGNNQPSGNFTIGCGDKNVGAVQSMIGLSVVCLGTEYDAYTWRSVPIAVDATVPEGWIATLHLSDDRIVVTETPGVYEIVAATFRRKAGYPGTDAVHNACSLLMKEKAFGASQNPSFDVEPLGFSCDGTSAVTAAPTATVADNACPADANVVASEIGGDSANWSKIEVNGFKYGPGAPSVSLRVPSGARIDHAGGSATEGSVTATEATVWYLSCEG